MKFTYIELNSQESAEDDIPGERIAKLICNALNGEGPYERGNYGWEWVFRGNNYKALAVLQQYDEGWLIPINVGFMDMILKRGATVLEDLSGGIESALGQELEKLQKFQSEQEFHDSGV